MLPKSRQTLSYLRNLFAHRGIVPQRQIGQNFLIDLNLHELIARTAELTPEDVVLEVGPGAGALTTLMAPQVSAVVAVEIDPAMARLTTEAASGLLNVRVLNVDALSGKNKVNPFVLDNVRAGLAIEPDRRLKLVANLPYNVATPLITNLLVHPELCPSLFVVTIQKELAERMIAAPATSDYSGLSILVQALADVEIVRTLSPKVFWPRPKVESAVVKITPSAEKRAAVGDLAWFHAVVRRIFLHRRKNLRGVLFSAWRDQWESKADVGALINGQGLAETGQIRAEAMNVEEFIALANALKARFAGQAVPPEDDAEEAPPDELEAEAEGSS